MKKMIYLTILSALFPGSFFSLDFGSFQLSVFRICLLGLAILFLMEIIKSKGEQIKTAVMSHYTLFFMMTWLIVSVLSGFWVIDYIPWFKAVYFIGTGTLTAFVFSEFLKDEKDVARVLRTISPVIAIHNVIGWSEVISKTYIFLSDQRLERYLRYKHPVSAFGNTNDFAIFLLFAVFFSLINWLNATRRAEKVFHALLMASSFLLIYFTGSRATMMGLLTAGGFLLVLKLVRRPPGTAKISAGLVLAGGLILLMFASGWMDGIASGISALVSGTSSASIRINLLRNGLYFLAQTRGIGVGAGNIESWMLRYPIHNTFEVLNIHNWWMEILVGYGAVIFILYLVFYARLLIGMTKSAVHSQDPLIRHLSLGMVLILAGFIFASVSSSSNINSEWLWVFWSIIIAFFNHGGKSAHEREGITAEKNN